MKESSSGCSFEVTEKIGRELDDELIFRLIAYARFKASKIHWQGMIGNPMPKGLTPKDVVSDAIKKTYSGERQWNPEKEPSLFKFLCSVIDSSINHIANWKENTNTQSESLISNSHMEKSPLLSIPHNDPSPESVLINSEEDKKIDNFLWGFHSFLDESSELQTYLECVIDGLEKPREIAEAMGIKTKEVNNLKKRMKRKLIFYQEQFKEKKEAKA